jgi:signal transduction histidine kinase
MMDFKQTMQLVQDNGSAEKADLEELHAIFIQNVSHELRTPLGIIQGYAELLRDGDLGALAPEQQQVVTTIVNRACQLRTIVERVGIILANKVHATASMPFPMDAIVIEVVEGKRASADEVGLELEMHLEPDLPLLAGDPDQLQHAVDCLLDNALKFTPRGGRVEVRLGTNG